MQQRTAVIPVAALALALVLALAGMAAGCGGDDGGPGPGTAVEEFYEHINAGNYAEAMALYSSEAMDTLEEYGGGETEAEGASAGFAGWARGETREGSLERVEILEVDGGADEATATVQYQVVYEDGTTARRQVTVIRENGSWKLNLIG